MATNHLLITAANVGEVHGLHGDMDVALNFTPTNRFEIGFFVMQAGTYVISSTGGTFRQPDGTLGPTLTLSGVNRFVNLMFNTSTNCWEMPENNLVGASSGGGGSGTPVPGPPGVAATLELGTYQLVAFDQPLEITMTGTATNRILNFKVPGPAPAATGGGTGTGAAFSPEVLLVPDASGVLTPNKANGNNFRVMMTQNLTMANPVGYQVGEVINIAVRQGPAGPYLMSWGLNWAHPDRAVPDLAKTPGGLNRVTAYLTAPIDNGNPGGWETDVSPKGSSIGYGVPSFIAKNLTTGVSYYVLRSPTLLSGMTDMHPGQTLLILRNGLGIEAYGAIDGSNGTGNFLISGALPNGTRAELHTGPGVRTAFDKGIFSFGGNGTYTVNDLILSGAREQSGASHIAQGVDLTGSSNVTLNNVRIYDCEDGILSGNIGNANPSDDYTGTLTLNNCDLDGNGVGDDGLTHGIYMGHNNANWTANDTTFRNTQRGHNVKSRSAVTNLNRCLIINSLTGRELELPNGGRLYATDGRIEKSDGAAQNDMIHIGDEGTDTSRPREYVFRNMYLKNAKNAANAASFIWNEDPDVDVYVIDCVLDGAKNWPGCDANGMKGRVIVQYTPGVTPGPRSATIGAQPKANTPVA